MGTRRRSRVKAKHLGLHDYRFLDNKLEKAFALAWQHENEVGDTLAYLLRPLEEIPIYYTTRPPDPAADAAKVAATVIQWLGSPVGQAFLAQVIASDDAAGLRERIKRELEREKQ